MQNRGVQRHSAPRYAIGALKLLLPPMSKIA